MSKIIIGPSINRPVISIVAAASEHAGTDIPNLPDHPIWRIFSQISPDIFINSKISSSTLMEVQVNGALAAASDGNGFRAFVINDSGISEHARLFELSNLSLVADINLLWRLAAAVVGQKYLSEIFDSINEIKREISEIVELQKNEIEARIQSCLSQMRQIHSALSSGERSAAVRFKLEQIDSDLDVAQRQFEFFLGEQIKRLDLKVENLKYEQLLRNLYGINKKLENFLSMHALASQIRIAAAKALSLFPNESALEKARIGEISAGLTRYEDLVVEIAIELSNCVQQWSNESEKKAYTMLDLSFQTWNLAASFFERPDKKIKVLSSFTPELDRAKKTAFNIIDLFSKKALEKVKRLRRANVAVGLAAIDFDDQVRYMVKFHNKKIQWIRTF